MMVKHSSPDSMTPGFYYDGCSMWIVTDEHMMYSVGNSSTCITSFENSGGMNADDAIGIIDAVERVIRTSNGQSN